MMLPWPEMMRSALAAGIGPQDFWRLSLREWRWLAARGAGLGAGRLAELMAGFPDESPVDPYRSPGDCEAIADPPLTPPLQGGERLLKQGGCCLGSSPCKGEDRWGSERKKGK